MRQLVENLIGDYAAYTKAAIDPNNDSFVHMTPPRDIKTITHFLQSLEDKGVIFCASESIVDCEFWIACPKKITDPLMTALRDWTHNGRGEISMPQPKRGIFHSIMDLPFSF